MSQINNVELDNEGFPVGISKSSLLRKIEDCYDGNAPMPTNHSEWLEEWKRAKVHILPLLDGKLTKKFNLTYNVDKNDFNFELTKLLESRTPEFPPGITLLSILLEFITSGSTDFLEDLLSKDKDKDVVSRIVDKIKSNQHNVNFTFSGKYIEVRGSNKATPSKKFKVIKVLNMLRDRIEAIEVSILHTSRIGIIVNKVQDYYNNINNITKVGGEDVYLTIDPSEFIMCSENTNRWSSCFSIKGEYHVSTNAFIRTEGIAMLYILDTSGLKKFRQWVYISPDYDVFSKLKSYPNMSMYRSEVITSLLKDLLAPELNHTEWRYIKDATMLKAGDYRGNSNIYLDSGDTWYHSNVILFQREVEVPNGYCSEGSLEGSGYWFDDGEECGGCGRRVSDTWETFDNELLCEDCLRDYTYSSIYDTYIHDDDVLRTKDGDVYHIDDLDGKVFECGACGEIVSETFMTFDDKLVACEDCLRDYTYSDIYGTYIHNDDVLRTEDGEVYHIDDLGVEVYRCATCGEIVSRTSMAFDKLICEDCYDELGEIEL